MGKINMIGLYQISCEQRLKISVLNSGALLIFREKEKNFKKILKLFVLFGLPMI